MGKAGMEQAATELVEVQAMMHTKTHQKNKTAELQYYERQADKAMLSINQSRFFIVA